VIRFVKLRWIPTLLVVGILGATALRIVGTHLWQGHRLAAYTLMPCRADALLLGVLAAHAMRNGASIWLAGRRKLLWGAAAVLIAGAVVLTWKVHTLDNLNNALMTSVGYTWIALLYTCVLLLAVSQPDSCLGMVMRWRWLRWLGSIAYGVYLIHLQVAFIIFNLARNYLRLELRTPYDLAAIVFALAITLGICQVSFHYFEKPLIRLGHKNPARFAMASKARSTEPAMEISVD
jgi:peptidoglycan/LPS O-acetylase OafA/YrhL